MTKVDYCNIALASPPQYDLQRLQTVINAAARLTASACKYDHVTPLLKEYIGLAASARMRPVQAVCPDIPMSQWVSTTVSCLNF